MSRPDLADRLRPSTFFEATLGPSFFLGAPATCRVVWVRQLKALATSSQEGQIIPDINGFVLLVFA